MAELTEAERKWIASFKRCMAKCPPTLGLWPSATSGTDLHVVALAENGSTSHEVDGDPDTVFTIDSAKVTCSGGDPTWREFEDLERPWVAEAVERDHG